MREPGSGRAACGSATVPPSDYQTEPDMEPAEAQRHQPVAPTSRSEQRECTERHEAKAHERNGTNRVGAAGHDAGAIEEEPGTRKRRHESSVDQHYGEQDADQEWRDVAQNEATARVAKHRCAAPARLGSHGASADRQRYDGGGEPGGEPNRGAPMLIGD